MSFELKIILIICLIMFGQSFSILGEWNLKQITDYPVISQLVQIKIEDLIYRETQVRQKLQINGCLSYKYLTQIDEQNIFIQYSTYQLIQNQRKSNCSNDIENMHLFLKNKLKQVFSFKIFGNILVFLNAKKSAVLRFERKNNSKKISLIGQWNLIRLNSKKVSDILMITQSQIVLCQNKLKVNYTLSNKYSIKTQIIEDNGCKIQGLQQKILGIKFFRRNNNSLQFYDKQLNLQIQLNLITQIPKIIPIQNNKQVEKLKQFKLTNTQADFIGQWQPLSIFGMPLEPSSISIIFTGNQVSYNGGCNNFVFQYNLDKVQNKINLGQNKQTSNICQINDDGLYINALWKITKFSFILSKNQILLTLKDAIGKPLYQLKRTINNNLQTQINKKPIQQVKITPLPAIIEINGIQPSRYIFLILSRRDLPRKFCTLTDQKIIYEGCNIIEHNYKIVNKDQIIINGLIIGNKFCQNNNDQLLLNQFNSIKSFQKTQQTGSYMLKDILNNPIINLSLF